MHRLVAFRSSVCLGFFLSFAAFFSAGATGLNSRFGGTGRTLPASDVVGATASEFGVSSSGTASYSTPIMVPIGTTGVQPKLTLDYSSGGGKGAMGFGGSIGGLSVISRCGSDLYHDAVIKPINFTATDKFCLNGERLVPVNGAYGAAGTEYRTSLEEFSRIISYGSAGSGPQYFKVWKKSGEILEYGNTTDSFIGALGRSEARAWAMNKLSDTAGNYVKYTYFQNSSTGEYGISRIDYTGNDAQGLAPYNSVQFVYAASPKTSIGDFAGQQYTHTQRLTNVKVYADATLYRDYQLAYLSANQLSTITECTASACFKPTTFTWAAAEDLPAGTSPFTNSSGPLAGQLAGYDVVATGDFNGDGITDFLMMALDQYGSKSSSSNDYLFLGQSSGTFQRLSLGANSAPVGYKIAAIGDFDGDGRLDLLLAANPSHSSGVSVSATNSYTWLSKGDGTFKIVTIPPPSSSGAGNALYAADVNFRSFYGGNTSIGDVNGDGLTDLYILAIDQYGRKVAGYNDHVWLSKGDGTFQDVDLGASASLPANYKIVSGGDFNGDGLTDLYMMQVDQYGRRAAGWTNNAVPYTLDKAYLAKGDGTFVISSLGAAPACTLVRGVCAPVSDPDNGYLAAASGNFNSDSLTDLYWYSADTYGRKSGTASDRVLLSKGDGTFLETSLASAASLQNQFKITGSGDFNNDGLTDFWAPRKIGLP